MIQKCKKFAVLFSAIIIAVSFPFSASAQTVRRGDADMNGEVDVSDARKTLRYAVGLDIMTVGAVKICDINGDGSVDVSDARAVLRHAVGLEIINGDPLELADEELNPPSEGELLGDLSAYPLPAVPQYEKKPGYFTFVVYGNGHGVGLSQYGAVYMAEKGCSYQYILSHYFSGSVICQDEDFPAVSVYCGEEYDTLELLCRMVAQEIGGIKPPVEALKAQTVAIFTLLQKYSFNVKGIWDVATVCGTSSRIWTNDWTQNTLIPTVLSVAGQYLAKADDVSRTPIMSVYSSMAAGATVTCSDIWYESYPVSVKSPFEMTMGNFVSVVQFSSDEIKTKILKAFPDTVLGDDPSTWIIILSHTASIDADRGYVTQVLVGDTLLSKAEKLSDRLGLGLRSGCFTVEYTK